MATTENLNTLKIHKLSQEQYDREKEAGRLDNSAIYLTPESDGSAPSNMVTTDTDQTITGTKTFLSDVQFGRQDIDATTPPVVVNSTYGYIALGEVDLNSYATKLTFSERGANVDYFGKYIKYPSYNYTLNLPEPQSDETHTLATQEWVNGVIAGKVDYLGVVNSQDELAQLAVQIQSSFDDKDPMKTVVGDYCRAGAAFNLYEASAAGYIGEKVHVGDILIYKGTGTAPDAGNWDIIHTEDPGNYVTLNTVQTITGKKTFEGGFEAVDAVFNTSATFNGGMYLSNNNGKWLSIDPTGINGENESQQLYNVSFPTTTGTLATQEWVNENKGFTPTSYAPIETTPSQSFTFNLGEEGIVNNGVYLVEINTIAGDQDCIGASLTFTGEKATLWVASPCVHYWMSGDGGKKEIYPNTYIEAYSMGPYQIYVGIVTLNDSKTVAVDPAHVKLTRIA